VSRVRVRTHRLTMLRSIWETTVGSVATRSKTKMAPKGAIIWFRGCPCRISHHPSAQHQPQARLRIISESSRNHHCQLIGSRVSPLISTSQLRLLGSTHKPQFGSDSSSILHRLIIGSPLASESHLDSGFTLVNSPIPWIDFARLGSGFTLSPAPLYLSSPNEESA
jgi:hypothetical protein